MTGIERLRKLSYDFTYCRLWYALLDGTEEDWGCYRGDDMTVSDVLEAIADQIEREQGGRVSRMRVLAVVMEMERHVSGVEGMEDSPVARWARELREALGGDGRDHAADVSVSAYDLLPQEDREAIAWVREHGGIAYVKDAWNVRSNLDRQLETAKAKVERQQRHIEEIQAKLSERRDKINVMRAQIAEMRPRLMPEGMDEEFIKLHMSNLWGFMFDVMDRLGVDKSDSDAPEIVFEALDRRLMPEGCEWPTVDGEPVVIDERMRSCGIEDCKVVGIDPANARIFLAFDDIEKGKAVYFPDSARYCHRPAPKVLDADGEEIRVGDTVWDVEFGCEFVVTKVADGTVFVAFEDVEADRRDPAGLTHRAPVLAADGEPLEVGQTVYGVDDGIERKVYEIDTSKVTSVAVDRTSCGYVYRRPEGLTHQRPVLDADGVPIKKGDTVYLLPGEWCDEFPCLGFHGGEELEVFADGEARHVPGGVQCHETEKKVGFRGYCYPQPSQLTHTKPEPPESWERIEEDKDLNPFDYCKKVGHKLWTFDNAEEFKACDLVRRCRALAERERGE